MSGLKTKVSINGHHVQSTSSLLVLNTARIHILNIWRLDVAKLISSRCSNLRTRFFKHSITQVNYGREVKQLNKLAIMAIMCSMIDFKTV